MNAAQFARTAIEDMQRGFRVEVEPLTEEQLVFRPLAEANTIIFLLWHANRNEDEMFHSRVSGEASLWEREGWHDRFGLTAKETGMGFSSEQVGAFRPARADLMAYCERVWEVVPARVGGLSDAEMERAPNPQRPDMTVGRTLGNFILGHGFWHLGDIRFLKGLQGMPFGR